MGNAEVRRLKDVFESVRKAFFPHWDRNRNWKVRKKKDLPCDGLCDLHLKAISLQYISKNDDKLSRLLIHEICHCFSPRHGKRWQDQMVKRAQKANQIGRDELARLIMEDVEGYRKAPIIRAKDVYGRVEDIVTEDSEEGISFEDLVKCLASELGMYPEELLEGYKKLKEAFSKANRVVERERELRKKFEREWSETKGGDDLQSEGWPETR